MPIDDQAQKSEVHESTADASTSPTGGGDQDTTRRAHGAPSPADHSNALDPEPPSDIRIISDETDDGGPLVVESNDPDLNPPRVPIDPFPTERKPEIDPPVK